MINQPNPHESVPPIRGAEETPKPPVVSRREISCTSIVYFMSFIWSFSHSSASLVVRSDIPLLLIFFLNSLMSHTWPYPSISMSSHSKCFCDHDFIVIYYLIRDRVENFLCIYSGISICPSNPERSLKKLCKLLNLTSGQNQMIYCYQSSRKSTFSFGYQRLSGPSSSFSSFF